MVRRRAASPAIVEAAGTRARAQTIASSIRFARTVACAIAAFLPIAPWTATTARADCECAIEDFLARAWTTPGGDGRTYAIVVAVEPWSWHQARDRASTLGATLASTPTVAATAAAFALAHAPEAPAGVFDCAGPWLGARRPAGAASLSAGWSWLSGATFTPAAWDAGAPSRSRLLEATALLAQAEPTWIDTLPGPDAGASTRSAIFVWDTFDDCNSNGLPDPLEIARDPRLDPDGNGAIEGCSAADLNGDGRVDARDLATLLIAFGTTGPLGDLDGSGLVNAADLTLLLAAWG
jgi:hypothetical protein